jgi:hypothetical protein
VISEDWASLQKREFDVVLLQSAFMHIVLADELKSIIRVYNGINGILRV